MPRLLPALVFMILFDATRLHNPFPRFHVGMLTDAGCKVLQSYAVEEVKDVPVRGRQIFELQRRLESVSNKTLKVFSVFSVFFTFFQLKGFYFSVVELHYHRYNVVEFRHGIFFLLF